MFSFVSSSLSAGSFGSLPALLAFSTEPLAHLRLLDIFVIAIYFVMVIWIGFYLKGRSNTSEEFFMAGREMTAWIAGLSFVSANLGSLELMGWAGSAYQYGILATHWYWIGAIPAMVFLGLVMMPFYYVCKTHSVPGYLDLRFGGAARSVAAFSFATEMILMSGVNMFAMAVVMKVVLGWDISFSIFVSSIAVAVYVGLGGLRSAIFNEVLQFCLIWGGALLVPILGLIQTGGVAGLKRQIMTNMQSMTGVHSDSYFHMWRDTGSFAANPMGVHWTGIVFGLGFVISFGYWTTDFLVVQRVLAAHNLRAARMAPIIASFFKMAVPFIVILPGLLGLVLLQNPDGSRRQLVGEDVVAACSVSSSGQVDDAASCSAAMAKTSLPPEYQQKVLSGAPGAELHSYNQALPLMMVRYLGPGLLGLGITALIAGFMSGMAGNVSAFSTVWTYDIYKPLINKKGSDSHYVMVGRLSILIGVAVSIGAAYLVCTRTASWTTCRRCSASLLRRCSPPSSSACSGSAPPSWPASSACCLASSFQPACSCGSSWSPPRWLTLPFRPTPSQWPRMCSERSGHSSSPPSSSSWSACSPSQGPCRNSKAWSTAPQFCPRKSRCRSIAMNTRGRSW